MNEDDYGKLNDPEFKKKWIEALRSGKYAQAKGFLRTNTGYCCLGVAADIIDPDGWEMEHHGNIQCYAFGLSSVKRETKSLSYLRYEVLDIIGNISQNVLSVMNDDGASFEDIANWIEKNL